MHGRGHLHNKHACYNAPYGTTTYYIHTINDFAAHIKHKTIFYYKTV